MPKTVAEINAGHSRDTMLSHIGYAMTEFPALYAIEMHHWKEAAALQPPADAKPLDQLTSVWARAIGAGFLRDVDGTRKDLEQYDSLVQSVRKSQDGYLVDQLMGVPRDEISAWVAFADKKNDEEFASCVAPLTGKMQKARVRRKSPRARCSPTCFWN